MNYPTMKEVEAADQQALLKWDRNLPGPQTPDQQAVAARIVERFAAGGYVEGAAKELLRKAGFGDLFG